MSFSSTQEKFWANEYAELYIKKNGSFNTELGIRCWNKMLNGITINIVNYLECGCNIGRNIEQLKFLLPRARPSIIEVSTLAYNIVTKKFVFANQFNGTILDSKFEPKSFDLVFTMGVLIHINPNQLLANIKKIFDYSSRYILIGEYFNRTPIAIEYQGEQDKLFKRDFGKLLMENFAVKLVDYGFLWGYLNDAAGFDDITWWLFEKSE
ncbi:MAG: methyltransferase domain-containing protein [Coxiellaceae bacterium]|nr:methyltransferase domain-containing protein [Coxiellaceae bacterium]